MKKLLLIDDDKELVSLLSDFLRKENFIVDIAFDGEQGLQKALSGDYDMLILDAMMPRMNGMDMLKLLRQKSDVPVLILANKGDPIDKALGVAMNADDYLTKPFCERDLLAQTLSILRRNQHKKIDPKDMISYLDVQLYHDQQQVICQNFTIELTTTELLLLETFLTHPGKIFSKVELSEDILGKKLLPFDRSIDMHLSNIRRKLPPRIDGNTRVKNFRGKGYMWVEDTLQIPA
ncbi:copper-sensing two-component system response regulator CpxR [Psychromonas sp. CNPT3]|uniref:response regulator n=1 Tax=Psychromonas sp. CNPT3 TaxID=314282 RepID=UPI00006E5882|nr:response regulator [Psychromonas sp. CNPT3]AGH80406.1 copper-sensing two-component system response regulator CpxR [Psychromonas sp. CNPT3]